MKSTEYRKAGKGRPALSVFACGLAAFIVTMGFVLFSCKTSFDHIPRQLYGIVYDTRKVAGLVVRDKAGEVYESETSFIFERKYGGEAVSGGRMDFTFFLDVAEGFDESDVSFDDPNVACDIGPARGRTISNGLNVDRLNIDRLNVNAGAIADGWRRLTVHCEDFDTSKALTVKLRYSAEALLLRDAAAGYYRWDVDEYTEEDILELDDAMRSFKDIYACANWIQKHVSYETVVEDPQTAAETFRSGRGDCDDRALLFCYMVERLLPGMNPRIVEGWAEDGNYHANVELLTDEGWLMVDPSADSVRFGVFNFHPFVPSGAVSPPFNITDADGRAVANGGIGISFGSGTVRALNES